MRKGSETEREDDPWTEESDHPVPQRPLVGLNEDLQTGLECRDAPSRHGDSTSGPTTRTRDPQSSGTYSVVRGEGIGRGHRERIRDRSLTPEFSPGSVGIDVSTPTIK